MKWMTFFEDFFHVDQESMARILSADGCRECWLQGQIFLFCNDGTIQTNSMREKYDLCGENPPMICEIKICGGDYQSKMKRFIQDDIDKLRKAKHECEKFMILLVDNRHPNTSLGKWLNEYQIENSEYTEVAAHHFKARIWKLL